jgi:hypothetical protein
MVFPIPDFRGQLVIDGNNFNVEMSSPLRLRGPQIAGDQWMIRIRVTAPADLNPRILQRLRAIDNLAAQAIQNAGFFNQLHFFAIRADEASIFNYRLQFLNMFANQRIVGSPPGGAPED